jgi:hypothetical protein
VASLCRDASLGGQRGSLKVTLEQATQPRRDFTTMTPTLRTFGRIAYTGGVPSLMMTALAFAGILLLSNVPLISDRVHAYLSSVPLAMAGVGYAALQLRARPPRGTLFKRLLLAATFVIWAVDQLLPSGRLATLIGDAVIAAYVLDLFWLSQEQASSKFLLVDGVKKSSPN